MSTAKSRIQSACEELGAIAKRYKVQITAAIVDEQSGYTSVMASVDGPEASEVDVLQFAHRAASLMVDRLVKASPTIAAKASGIGGNLVH